jgi:hypothetical protein
MFYFIICDMNVPTYHAPRRCLQVQLLQAVGPKSVLDSPWCHKICCYLAGSSSNSCAFLQGTELAATGPGEIRRCLPRQSASPSTRLSTCSQRHRQPHLEGAPLCICVWLMRMEMRGFCAFGGSICLYLCCVYSS